MMEASFPRINVDNTNTHTSFFSLMGYGIKLLFKDINNFDDNNISRNKNEWYTLIIYYIFIRFCDIIS